MDSIMQKWILRRIFLAIFLVLGTLGAAIAILWLFACIIFRPNGERSCRISIAFDQLFNAATGGHEDETVSSRAGKMVAKGEKGWPCILCKALDFFQRAHCALSIGT